MKKQAENTLTIGRLAEECGVTIDTIRYYERFKLMQAHGRSKAGYRLYGPESVRRLNFIKRSKDLGFTLDEIRKLLALKSSKDATCAEMLERTHAKVAEAKEQVRALTHIEEALTRLSAICPGGNMPISKCPILDHLYPEEIKRKHHEG